MIFIITFVMSINDKRIMKSTTVEIKSRTNYDIVRIQLPNGCILRVETSPSCNEVEITHISENNETMFIKPMMGNQFKIVTTSL